MSPITNLNQLNQLMNSTMIYAVIVGLVAVLVVLAVANMFPWEGGSDLLFSDSGSTMIYMSWAILGMRGSKVCLRLAT